MESWFCVWDDLLRLFAIARIANPEDKSEFNPKTQESRGDVVLNFLCIPDNY
jgi:uncharacterized protein with NRDE domain